MFNLSPYTINKYTIQLDITVTRWSRYNLYITATSLNLITITQEDITNTLELMIEDISGDIDMVVDTINNLTLTIASNTITFNVDTINNLDMSPQEPNIVTFTTSRDTYTNLNMSLSYNNLDITHEGYNNTTLFETEQLSNTITLNVEGAEIT